MRWAKKGTWRVRRAPKAWNEEDLLGVLAAAKWTEVEIIAPPMAGVRPWLIRARPPVGLIGDIGCVYAGDVTITLARAARA